LTKTSLLRSRILSFYLRIFKGKLLIRFPILNPPEDIGFSFGNAGNIFLLFPIEPIKFEKLEIIPLPPLLLRIDKYEPIGPKNGILR
jgi:hypothetical protein